MLFFFCLREKLNYWLRSIGALQNCLLDLFLLFCCNFRCYTAKIMCAFLFALSGLPFSAATYFDDQINLVFPKYSENTNIIRRNKFIPHLVCLLRFFFYLKIEIQLGVSGWFIECFVGHTWKMRSTQTLTVKDFFNKFICVACEQIYKLLFCSYLNVLIVDEVNRAYDCIEIVLGHFFGY